MDIRRPHVPDGPTSLRCGSYRGTHVGLAARPKLASVFCATRPGALPGWRRRRGPDEATACAHTALCVRERACASFAQATKKSSCGGCLMFVRAKKKITPDVRRSGPAAKPDLRGRSGVRWATSRAAARQRRRPSRSRWHRRDSHTRGHDKKDRQHSRKPCQNLT